MTDTLTAAPAAPATIGRGATRRPGSAVLDFVFAALLFVGTIAGVVALGTLLWKVYDTGWARLMDDPGAFINEFVSRFPARAGIKAALFGSLYLMVGVAIISFPVGVGAAIYLEEFATHGRFARLVEANIANLAGVPSVVYGILGLGVFVPIFGPGILTGALTLAVMTLPVVIITSREAIRAVPSSIRQGSYALGGTKLQTVRRLVLPSALPGILTGTILGLSRAIGETAPLLVIGAAVSVFQTPQGLRDPFTAIPVQIYTWTGRPQAGFAEAAAAAIIVLLAMLLAMNAVAIFLRNRYTIRW